MCFSLSPPALAEVRDSPGAPGLQVLSGLRDGSGWDGLFTDAGHQPVWTERVHTEMGGPLLLTLWPCDLWPKIWNTHTHTHTCCHRDWGAALTGAWAGQMELLLRSGSLCGRTSLSLFRCGTVKTRLKRETRQNLLESNQVHLKENLTEGQTGRQTDGLQFY